LLLQGDRLALMLRTCAREYGQHPFLKQTADKQLNWKGGSGMMEIQMDAQWLEG
jgi:hypothetical protein